MAALDFPATPTVGQKYPAPGIPGIPVYTWDGEKWTTVGGDVGTLLGATALPLAPVDPAVVGTSNKYAREDHKHPTNAATAAEYLANVGATQNKTMTPKTIWDSVVQVTLVDAASVAPNLALGSDFTWQPGTSRTLANPTNGKPGQKGVIYCLPGLGSVTAFGSAYKFPNGIKPVHSGVMIISYVVGNDGVTMYCSALNAMA